MPVRTADDPLDEVLKPPPDESPEDRVVRLQNEAEAKRVSLAIDASIKAERHARRKKRIVRLLLLGQSESGKSTTLRQFQRLYTPTAFREERILWRAVIQLNIVRSIRTILDALTFPSTSTSSPHTSPYSSPRSRARTISRPPLPNHPHEQYNGNGNDTTLTFGSSSSPPRVRHRHHHHSPPSNPDSDGDSESDFVHPHHHIHHRSPRSTSPLTLAQNTPLDALKARLLPLRHIEALLIAKLVPPNEEEATHFARPGPPGVGVGAGTSAGSSSGASSTSGGTGNHAYRNQEIFVRPGTGWKGGLARARVTYPGSGYGYGDDRGVKQNGSSGKGSSGGNGTRPMSAGTTGLETQDEPQEVLNMCRRDMIALWNDEGVREVLRRRKIRIEEESGFFLDDLERLTSLKYMPTDDDVLKARLKTVGVSEYKFEMEATAGRDSGTEWRIVDVGGSRSQRPTWAPFFDDVDAIIFLAPISGFDQVLSEDRTVNRLFVRSFGGFVRCRDVAVLPSLLFLQSMLFLLFALPSLCLPLEGQLWVSFQ
ncbi:guanine nucleotide-binding protein alpha-4 subunit [Laccaria bicolor S238N-H82]|uniref:Guanine nucleotide-binding protein alpha-4 subunit n=1 Tax=Laccaria bicolor (strain S238N-H82 / ATCC MYA-4686) TaxID=486041 RepID=B0DZP0_LACBS|nr:guanine nucleotide-binding protein alpha-4 subunit [Laccaria bicolor S238N-H82]EDQ99979.1 guanine nucleotide-binding protein alpha-4 subunit [Laccaria bicolor S238N-H82]|eukprot:XP_001889390.1 guanine nucleotide-binding protein alpha-4 subunit [Laccaria bicolor S238N-H82]